MCCWISTDMQRLSYGKWLMLIACWPFSCCCRIGTCICGQRRASYRSSFSWSGSSFWICYPCTCVSLGKIWWSTCRLFQQSISHVTSLSGCDGCTGAVVSVVMLQRHTGWGLVPSVGWRRWWWAVWLFICPQNSQTWRLQSMSSNLVLIQKSKIMMLMCMAVAMGGCATYGFVCSNHWGHMVPLCIDLRVCDSCNWNLV